MKAFLQKCISPDTRVGSVVLGIIAALLIHSLIREVINTQVERTFNSVSRERSEFVMRYDGVVKLFVEATGWEEQQVRDFLDENRAPNGRTKALPKR